jgi:hypothetical protein
MIVFASAVAIQLSTELQNEEIEQKSEPFIFAKRDANLKLWLGIAATVAVAQW